MKEQKLSTDGRPIFFMGELLCKETTREEEGPNSSRWWRAELYRVVVNQSTQDEHWFYRVGLAHITLWKDSERDEFFVGDGDDKKSIIAYIRKHDPELAQKMHESWKYDERLGSHMESKPL